MLRMGSNSKPGRLSRHALAVGIVCLVLVAAYTTTVLGATAPGLGTADSFAVLAGSAVTNTGATAVGGDLGVSPSEAISGFPPGTVSGTQYVGAAAAQPQADVTTAYDALGSQACDVDLTGQNLGGKTLTTGVYCFDSTADLTGDLVLDADGDSDAVFIFKIGSALTTASGATVTMIGGGNPCNVFWQVGSSATLGTATEFIGNILAYASITLTTDAGIDGRALARTGAVTMDTNDVSIAACQGTAVRIAGIRATSASIPVNFGIALCVGAVGLALMLIATATRNRTSGSSGHL